MTVEYLGLLLGLLTVESGVVSDSVAAFGTFPSYQSVLSSLNRRGGAQSHYNLIHHGWLMFMRGLPFSEETKEEEWM